MSERVTFEIELPADAAQVVHERVSSGRYASPSEVLAEAVRDSLLAERERAVWVDLLREKVRVGLEQSDRGEVSDASGVFDEIRERGARRREGNTP